MVEDCRTYKDESVEERSWNEETNCQVRILTVCVDGCMMNIVTKVEVEGEKHQDMYTTLNAKAGKMQTERTVDSPVAA